MSERTDIRLKITFYLHFTLIALSLAGRWHPNAYLFYNLLFILMLLWGMFDRITAEPVQHSILINGISIFLDIILLAIAFPHDGREQFSAAMAILNLVCRPFSIILLHRILQERNGTMGPLEGIGNIFTGQPSNYQDIDRPTTAQQQQQQQQQQQSHPDFFASPQQL